MEDVLINLRVISHLEPYQRLHTRKVHFRIYENRYLPEWFVRWLDGATRGSDFGRIRDVYMRALEILIILLSRISYKIRCTGLVFEETYENDQTMLARIDTLIETITKSLDGVCEEWSV